MEYNKSKSSIIAEYYTLHLQELRAFVGSRLQFAEETEDVVQDVFVRLLQMDQMITPITLPSLVYTTARNLIADYWRHHQCINEYEHFIRKSDWQNNYIQDGESIYSAQEITELLERGIARLSEKQRKVYRLSVYDGLKISEISTELDLAYKNVENRLGAARKQVRGYIRSMLAS